MIRNLDGMLYGNEEMTSIKILFGEAFFYR